MDLHTSPPFLKPWGLFNRMLLFSFFFVVTSTLWDYCLWICFAWFTRRNKIMQTTLNSVCSGFISPHDGLRVIYWVFFFLQPLREETLWRNTPPRLIYESLAPPVVRAKSIALLLRELILCWYLCPKACVGSYYLLVLLLLLQTASQCTCVAWKLKHTIWSGTSRTIPGIISNFAM